jgi:Zn-dependent oligopeptidase
MTFSPGVSGNPHGNRHRTRHLLNQEFMQALLLHFRQHGKKAIEKVAREQPAAYLKILALLVPREHKVEHRNPLKELTDEELEAMLEHLKASLEAQAQSAKVIEGEAEVVPSLPAPGSGGTKMPKA